MIETENNNKNLQNERTIFVLPGNKETHIKLIIGLISYFIIFIVFIPILLIKNKYFNILAAYFPNLDLIATVLGYHGGPMNTNIWRHLYNPNNNTISGYISTNIINFFALLGITYIVAYYTFINKNIYKGWTRAFIMLPLSYFIPSNFIILFMNKFGIYLNNFFHGNGLLHYLLVILFGLFMILIIIISESVVIKNISPYLVSILHKIY